MISPSQRQILEAVLESLPIMDEVLDQDDVSMRSYRYGRNECLADARAIINEFLDSKVEND